MSTEYNIQTNCFLYISVYLANNGLEWTIDNLPRCGNSTFTFDSRAVEDTESPLFVIHTWSYQIARPTVAALLEIIPTDIANQKKLCYMLNSKKEIVQSMNLLRQSLGQQAMSTTDIIALAPTPCPDIY